MPTVTQEELNRFHRFATGKLGSGEVDFTWEELLLLWESSCHRDDVNACIHAGLADVEAGRHHSALEKMADIAREFGLPNP